MLADMEIYNNILESSEEVSSWWNGAKGVCVRLGCSCGGGGMTGALSIGDGKPLSCSLPPGVNNGGGALDEEGAMGG